jgi:hypothetical protein
LTFALVVASHSSVWACTDRQLTDVRPGRSTKSGVKVTCIEARDGVALLTYAGIGRVLDTQVSWWVYRSLISRDLPLEQSLGFIVDASLRRLRRAWVQLAGGHLFLAPALNKGKHRLYVIDLSQQPPNLYRRISPRRRSETIVAATGSGTRYMLTEVPRFRLLRRVIKQYNRRNVSEDFVAGQLAAINVAISARARAQSPPDNSISAESIVINRNDAKRGGGAPWCFDADGKRAWGDKSASIPHVGPGGSAMSDLVREVMAVMEKRFEGIPSREGEPPPEWFRAVEDTSWTKELQERVSKISDEPDEEFH